LQKAHRPAFRWRIKRGTVRESFLGSPRKLMYKEHCDLGTPHTNLWSSTKTPKPSPLQIAKFATYHTVVAHCTPLLMITYISQERVSVMNLHLELLETLKDVMLRYWVESIWTFIFKHVATLHAKMSFVLLLLT
jgi:hypothetical protein